MLRVTTILGTRPEIIRMASCIKLFDQVFHHRVIHTGQNYDSKLSSVFFGDLNLREPDKYLEGKANSFGGFISELFPRIEAELNEHKPDAVVILGDTNSALSSLVAKRLSIPIYHLEAGNRSFDQNVPEEINRKVVDHTSDFNLAYSEHGRANLIREGLHPRTLSVIGSPLREVITEQRPKIDASRILQELNLSNNGFILVSAHRQENIDDPIRLRNLIDALKKVLTELNLPLVVSTHPRLRDKLGAITEEFPEKFIFCEPFGFSDYLRLQIEAKLVISDSGSVSEEAAILGFNALTIRNSIERPEAIEAGTIILAGIEAATLESAVRFTLNVETHSSIPEDYQIEDTSIRVAKFIQSTLPQFHFWSGIRKLAPQSS